MYKSGGQIGINKFCRLFIGIRSDKRPYRYIESRILGPEQMKKDETKVPNSRRVV